jgi:hypothetical protein
MKLRDVRIGDTFMLLEDNMGLIAGIEFICREHCVQLPLGGSILYTRVEGRDWNDYYLEPDAEVEVEEETE